ncbi:hypothetical protein RIF29_28529 [Crotalaria pallida]|uniref:Pentatricopeptide repeat-containing protein n=1 Tax=Crotalaria pallida TaxID=3830 RepID=A0AAN9ED50_CROPI
MDKQRCLLRRFYGDPATASASFSPDLPAPTPLSPYSDHSQDTVVAAVDPGDTACGVKGSTAGVPITDSGSESVTMKAEREAHHSVTVKEKRDYVQEEGSTALLDEERKFLSHKSSEKRVCDSKMSLKPLETLPSDKVHMVTLLGQVCKHVSSSWTDALSKPYVAPWLTTVSHFSFTDDQSGSIKQHVGESDDFTLQQSDPNLNHNGSTTSQDGYNIEPIPSRSLKGRKPINQPSPHFREYSRGSHSFRPRFDDNHVRHANPSDVPASRHSEEAKRSDPNQPALESMPQDADQIFKRMKETGLIPNAVAMLDGLCKDGLVQEALKLFGLMREKGTIPKIVIYTAVVEGYTKAHKPDDAKRIFRKMQSTDILPNAFSYTVLIQGLYKCNMLQDAFEFCVEMLEAGHSPNVTTFVGLVDGFCKEKGVEEAKSAIKTLIEKGFVVNEKAVRELLDKKAPFSPSVWEAIFGKKPSC